MYVLNDTLCCYLQYEVDQSKQDAQGQTSATILLLVGHQIAKPGWQGHQRLVHLPNLLSHHKPFPL